MVYLFRVAKGGPNGSLGSFCVAGKVTNLLRDNSSFFDNLTRGFRP